jgi:hypothetical protein
MINWIHAGPSVTAACLGSLVECVGAATIVLAVGTVRGWRSALLGTASGLAVVTALVFVLGPVLGVIPVTALQFVIGLLLLSSVFYSCCSASAGCVKPYCGPRGPSLRKRPASYMSDAPFFASSRVSRAEGGEDMLKQLAMALLLALVASTGASVAWADVESDGTSINSIQAP